MDNPMIVAGGGGGGGGGAGCGSLLHRGSSGADILDLDGSEHSPLGHLLDPPCPSKKGGGAASSDEDEDHENVLSSENGQLARTKRDSPWQRMKWTDDVVRLLISFVAHVADHDEGGPDGKHGALQKKGKWKTVSKLMMERGCYVSPQQCEDKFNDLNKRYKRLKEILGRDTSCQVVENPALLDSMPHVSPKAKDDVRKILSSKHLFYREMCAYHNGPGIPNCHDAAGGVGVDDRHLQPACAFPLPRVPLSGSKGGNGHAYEVEEGEEDDDVEDEEEEKHEEHGKRSSGSLISEMDAAFCDRSESSSEQREWFKRRALVLEEERVEIATEALELEKRMFKWQRFRSKKDRELERLRLENERLKLENERVVMQVRQRVLELELQLDLRRSMDPSDPTGTSTAVAGILKMDSDQI